MKSRNVVLAMFLLTVASSAPARVDPVCAPRTTDPLQQRWWESEGDWRGVWDPTSAPSTGPSGERIASFHAVWHKGNESAEATLQVTITGNHIEIDRTQGRDTCHYRGNIVPNGTVHGSYTCSWHRIAQTWSARIGDPPDPYCAANDPRLSAPWFEREGAWAGRWTPTGVSGQYNAHFFRSNSRETDDATLTITITDNPLTHARNRVTVIRTEPRGTCTYDGWTTGNGWRAFGRYECSWGGGNLSWSATIGEGHP